MLIIADKQCVKKTFADNGDTALLVGGKKGHRRFVIVGTLATTCLPRTVSRDLEIAPTGECVVLDLGSPRGWWAVPTLQLQRCRDREIPPTACLPRTVS